MTTELVRVGQLIWLRQQLASGHARELVKAAGLSTGAVAKILGCTQPNAWRYLAGQQFPRRTRALKLIELLDQLEVIQLASEDAQR